MVMQIAQWFPDWEFFPNIPTLGVKAKMLCSKLLNAPVTKIESPKIHSETSIQPTLISGEVKSLESIWVDTKKNIQIANKPTLNMGATLCVHWADWASTLFTPTTSKNLLHILHIEGEGGGNSESQIRAALYRIGLAKQTQLVDNIAISLIPLLCEEKNVYFISL